MSARRTLSTTEGPLVALVETDGIEPSEATIRVSVERCPAGWTIDEAHAAMVLAIRDGRVRV